MHKRNDTQNSLSQYLSSEVGVDLQDVCMHRCMYVYLAIRMHVCWSHFLSLINSRQTNNRSVVMNTE